MKFNSIILSGILAMGCVTASAQEADKTVNVFNPHWYVQAQVGGQYTLGEIGFSDLISPNAQVGLGYNFNKVVGARLSFNAWQSKGGQKVNTTTYKWKWNYVAPMVDATFNLTNLFCEYNPERVVSVGVFGGIGANIAWSNEEAATAKAGIMSNYKNSSENPLEYLWKKTDGKGSKAFFAARLGANVDFRVSDRVSLGLEVSANTLSDHYNSKKAGNPDWYFNALVGAKIALGKTHTTKTIPAPKPVEKIIERVIEKQVVPAPAPVETKKEVAAEEFRRDIFFTIGNSVIAKSQASKITEIVNYMKENPDAKITLTGYADKGTGSDAINDKVAARRAQTVYNALAAKGVAKSRMIKKSAGSRVQPFSENGMNRVTICIAK
ncbi:OmpA family protein [Segatella copri]|uniref:OmpA family protein n=1 Tax=Prevotellaceae TaxID=171552 RepID=UPI0025EEA01E|nr:OmpA family protein [Segatella copri]WOG03329.1 OmpA family protein [Segatella copri]